MLNIISVATNYIIGANDIKNVLEKVAVILEFLIKFFIAAEANKI
jgi:hypothetical protein